MKRSLPYPIMLPGQLRRQLKTLDDLIMQAEHYADYCMRGSALSAFHSGGSGNR